MISIIQLEKYVRRHYNLHGNQKIIIDYNEYTFDMKLGEMWITLDIPIKYIRQEKLTELLRL